MTTQFEAAADDCIISFKLERCNEESEDDRDGTLEMLAAAEALTSGWLVPLGVDLMFVRCDPSKYFEHAGYPARATHFLRTATVPSDVFLEPALTDAEEAMVLSINAATIRSAVLQGLEQPAPPGLVTSLSIMTWECTRAKSPIDDTVELLTPHTVSPVSDIVDGSRWYFGPKTAVVGPPARLECINAHFSTEMLLEIKWDLWADYPPGRAMVDAGIARVLARPGWELWRRPDRK